MAGVRPSFLLVSLCLSLLGSGGARALVIPVDSTAGDDSRCVAAQDLSDVATEYPPGTGIELHTQQPVHRAVEMACESRIAAGENQAELMC